MLRRYGGQPADESAFRFHHGTTFTAGSLPAPLPAELTARTHTRIRESLVKLVSVVLDFVTVSCVAKLVVNLSLQYRLLEVYFSFSPYFYFQRTFQRAYFWVTQHS
jgi:hypothetical protein